MSADSLSQFTQALKHCDSCGSRCSATLPATDLTRAVKEVVSELTPRWWREAAPPADLPLETLLLILTYSYACGMFGSKEIADELEDRADRCALVKQVAIDAPTLAQFRRENHALLRRCLAAVLTRFHEVLPVGHRSQAATATGSPEFGSCVARSPDVDREAERRIIRAAQTDSEERDL